MTTILVHQNRIAVDRRILIRPFVGESYFDDSKSKLFITECKRAGFIFFFDQPCLENITPIMDDMLQGLIMMSMDNTYPSVMLKKETLVSIGKKTQIYVAIKDTIFYFPVLEDYFNTPDFRKAKSTDRFEMLMQRVSPNDFSACGAGDGYALGVYHADKTMSLEEIMSRVSTLSSGTSSTFDVIDCRKLKPLIALTKKRTVTKQIKGRKS